MKCGVPMEFHCPKCGAVTPGSGKFCIECGHKLDEPAEREESAPEAERKYVTVLFSDLSGYTSLSERVDPEEVREIMSRIFGEVAQVVAKYEGFIERFFGDEVMVLFGVPRAHEDDPVRAIRAAKEIHKLVEGMSPHYEARHWKGKTRTDRGHSQLGITTDCISAGDGDTGGPGYV